MLLGLLQVSGEAREELSRGAGGGVSQSVRAIQ